MLFLNRRGYAGFVSCRSCGHVMKCPHCDVSLSEHNNERLYVITVDMRQENPGYARCADRLILADLRQEHSRSRR